MKTKTYTQACAAVKHLLPDGCRFLKIGEPIPPNTKFIDEYGLIQISTLGAANLAAIHHPHFIEVALESVSDKILKAFSAHIKDLNSKADKFGKVKAYDTAAKFRARAEAMDEALGIAMKAVRL